MWRKFLKSAVSLFQKEYICDAILAITSMKDFQVYQGLIQAIQYLWTSFQKADCPSWPNIQNTEDVDCTTLKLFQFHRKCWMPTVLDDIIPAFPQLNGLQVCCPTTPNINPGNMIEKDHPVIWAYPNSENHCVLWLGVYLICC